MGTLLELGPKEVWSLITWFIYAVVFTPQTYGRMEKKEGRDAVGYRVIVVLFTFFGVNFLLKSVHTFQ